VPSPTPNKRHRAPVDVFKFRDYREFLAAYYAHKKREKGFSYRSFARAAGLGAPNYLKLVIDGKRNLSLEMAERFAAVCELSRESMEYFRLLVAFNHAKDDTERNQLHQQLGKFARFRSAQRLDLAQKEYHQSWYIPAVRELVACPDFVEDTAWIAKALKPPISEREASQALEVLQRLNMLERSETGRLVQVNRAVSTGPQASGLYIRNFHTEMMQRAQHAMHEIPAAERYLSALTLTASPALFDEVRRRVIAFRSELAALCDTEPHPSLVLQLNLQLFPLSETLAPAEHSIAIEPSTKKDPQR
jgi:uncharacterized protein (TIGR02147 family)